MSLRYLPTSFMAPGGIMLPGDHDEVYYRDDEERALAVAKADYVAGRISVYEFEDMVGAILAGEPNVVAVGMATAPERR